MPNAVSAISTTEADTNVQLPVRAKTMPSFINFWTDTTRPPSNYNPPK